MPYLQKLARFAGGPDHALGSFQGIGHHLFAINIDACFKEINRHWSMPEVGSSYHNSIQLLGVLCNQILIIFILGGLLFQFLEYANETVLAAIFPNIANGHYIEIGKF